MKFVKYNDNKSVTIPPAVLTVCGLDDEGKLEMAGARGAVRQGEDRAHHLHGGHLAF